MEFTGVFEIPETTTKKSKILDPNVTVIVDEIREPGNLGSIFLTLASCNIKKVILMKGNKIFFYYFKIILVNIC